MIKITELLVCPICLNKLNINNETLICTNVVCKAQYFIVNKIPNLIVEEADIKCPGCGIKRVWNNIEKVLYCKNCNLYVKRNNTPQ